MKIIVTDTFRFAHAGFLVKEYPASPDAQEIPDDAGQWALDNKHGKAAEKPQAKPPVELTQAMIVEAIGQLDKDNPALWTIGGAPQVKALVEVLGCEVTASQRDEAWMALQDSAE